MKSYAICIIFVFVTCFVRAFDEEEVFLFLPFLRTYEPPPPCPMNELYKLCTGKCSDCTQRGLCLVTTCIKGCDCAPHFYRVTPDGPCEPVANCPKPVCGENEVFRECGPICERCTTMKCRVIGCEHKCYCKEGFLRNAEGICIPADQCPPKLRCTMNEEWGDSGPVDEFCLHKDSNVTTEIRNVSQCYCKDGFKRNALGYCMREHLCPIVQCVGEEDYYDCVPKCNTTCRNLGDSECVDDGNCYPGCFCKPGFVMNDFRICIPIDNCSLEISQLKIINSYKLDDEDESGNATESHLGLDTYRKNTDGFDTYGNNSEGFDTYGNNTEGFDTYGNNTESFDTIENPSPDGVSTEGASVSDDSSRDAEVSIENSYAETTTSFTSSTPANVMSPKKKDRGKLKDSNVSSQKYAYATSSSKASSKQEASNAEEDFDNE